MTRHTPFPTPTQKRLNKGDNSDQVACKGRRAWRTLSVHPIKRQLINLISPRGRQVERERVPVTLIPGSLGWHTTHCRWRGTRQQKPLLQVAPTHLARCRCSAGLLLSDMIIRGRNTATEKKKISQKMAMTSGAAVFVTGC